MSPARRTENIILTLVTLTAAAIWIFPLYWAFITSIRSEERVVSNASLLPDEFQLTAYLEAIFNTKIMTWYFNSVGTAVIVTVVVILFSLM